MDLRASFGYRLETALQRPIPQTTEYSEWVKYTAQAVAGRGFGAAGCCKSKQIVGGLVELSGIEPEPNCGRLSPQAKSRAPQAGEGPEPW